MRTLVDLSLVTCQLKFSDGVEDIAAFKACAATANWTNDEINVAIVRAIYAVSDSSSLVKYFSNTALARLPFELRNCQWS
jgi:hypothetical protein